MRRAVTPDFLESVANHPRVRPYIGGHGEFRAGESWAQTVALEWDEGGIVFLREAPGRYSVHVVFLPKTKGAADKLRQALGYVFALDAQTVIGSTPTKYRHVRKVAELAGLKHIKDESGFSHYRLTASEWTHRS